MSLNQLFPLKPTYFINGTVEQIDLELLARQGIKGLILDLDNTIMRPKSGYFCDKVLPWLNKVRFMKLGVIIVTNNTNDSYLQKIADVIADNKLPMITKAKKPRRAKLVEALEQLNLSAEEVCIVGDRVLTDVLGGVRLGMKTAYVKPLLGQEENLLFRSLRFLEELLLEKKL
jgi:uncharacterized protein